MQQNKVIFINFFLTEDYDSDPNWFFLCIHKECQECKKYKNKLVPTLKSDTSNCLVIELK